MSDAQGQPAAAQDRGGSPPAGRRSGTIGRRLRKYFLTGLVVLLPAVISMFVLWRLFTALDHILGRFVEVYMGYRIPGVGLVALLLLIVGIGAVASNFIGRKLIGVGEGVIDRIPILRWIYRTTKQISSAVLQERSTTFRKVVLVNYPLKGTYSMAFQTSESAGAIEDAVGKKLVTVFLPTTPNPTSGFFLLVPEDEVVPLDISVNEGLRYIISAGAVASRSADL